jgi:hypothetical protein
VGLRLNKCGNIHENARWSNQLQSIKFYIVVDKHQFSVGIPQRNRSNFVEVHESDGQSYEASVKNKNLIKVKVTRGKIK